MNSNAEIIQKYEILPNRKVRFIINVVYWTLCVLQGDKERDGESKKKETEIVVVMKNAWLWSWCEPIPCLSNRVNHLREDAH